MFINTIPIKNKSFEILDGVEINRRGKIMSEIKKIGEVLDKLKITTNVKEASVVSRSGLNMLESEKEKDRENKFAGMIATAMGSGEAALELKNIGFPSMVTIHGKRATLVIIPAGTEALLTLLFDNDCCVLPLAAIKFAAEEIADTLNN